MKHRQSLVLRLLFLVCVGACVLAAACSSQPGLLASEPDLTGMITGIQAKAAPSSGELIVESHAHKLVTRYRVAVTSDTFIGEEVRGRVESRSFWALAERQWVRVWFVEGQPAEDPDRAEAAQIVVFQP